MPHLLSILTSSLEYESEFLALKIRKNSLHTFYLSFHLFFAVAGHYADILITQRWSVLSVRRLMSSIGLIGPGVFLLMFCAVDNLLAAVM